LPKQQLATLQLGRAFAAISVLLYHTNATLALPKYLGHSVFPSLWPADAGVHYFFVLSGFVIWTAHHADLGRPQRTAAFFWKRFRRVYVPLWIVLLGLTAVFLLAPSLGNGSETDPSTLLAAFLITPFEHERLLGPEWTLRHEVLFYCMFGLAIALPRIGIWLAATWIALSCATPWLGWRFPWSFVFADYHLLFLFGMFAGWAFRHYARLPSRVLLCLGACLFAGTWALLCARFLAKDWLSHWLFGLGASCLVLGAAAWERERMPTISRALTFLGDASYAIYLVHFPVISLACKLFASRGSPQLSFCACAAVALAAGIAFHVLIEKPLLASVSAAGAWRWRGVRTEPRADRCATGKPSCRRSTL
jgi:exopolysaccharide production protein ExoZ